VAEQTFAPEQNWTYELGSKNTLLDRRALLNANLFYVRWNNLQIRQEPSNAGGAIAPNITKNQGGATSRGVEVEAQWLAAHGLQFMAAAAYVDSRFDAGEVSGQVRGLCDGRVCPLDGAIGGRQLPRHSKVQATAAVTWRQALAAGLAGFVHAELTHQSKQQVDEANIAQVPGRTLVNVSTGVDTGTWSLSLWGRNVFNRHYVADAYFIPAASLHAVAYSPSLGELATYGLTFKLHLD
jgi:iron complex outermembrane receptor protein